MNAFESPPGLTILHVGAEARAHSVNGITNALWTIAVHQRRLGHKVQVLINEEPDEAAVTRANVCGLALVRVPETYRGVWDSLAALLNTSPPDIVHMHSVFAPDHAVIAALLRARAIPYVVKIGGGLAGHVLRRRRLKKAIYSALVERPRLNRSAGIAVVRPSEADEVRSYLPRYRGLLRWIPNPVEPASLSGRWSLLTARERTICYLGRFDVNQKGLDIVAAIAVRMPNLTFRFHGTAAPRDEEGLHNLMRTCPPNLHFHPPVYEAAKSGVLTGCTMYIQMSRSEGFSNSIAEAMYLGVPCAISETTNMAALFAENDLGCVLPADPVRAAEALEQALSDPAALTAWSERSRAFAMKNFDPEKVAAEYVDFYRAALERTPAMSPTKLSSSEKASSSGAA